MPRWFNIAGPCYADEHFMVPPEGRAAAALPLIEQGRWFSLVAGRQTGKTGQIFRPEANQKIYH